MTFTKNHIPSKEKLIFEKTISLKKMSQTKYFLKFSGLSDGSEEYSILSAKVSTVLSAKVSTVQEFLKNTQLINTLFEFSDSDTQLNDCFFGILSIPQISDETKCLGTCRSDFVNYYSSSGNPGLFDELNLDHHTSAAKSLKNCEGESTNSVYLFDSLEGIRDTLLSWRWIDSVHDPIQEVITV